jgi:hypothetical protein
MKSADATGSAGVPRGGFDPRNDRLRLRRLTCGKASPFRTTCILGDFLCAGRKAEPSGRLGEGEGPRLVGKPEAFRKSGRQSRRQQSLGLLIRTDIGA